MSREFLFRLLGLVLSLCLAIPCQLMLNDDAENFVEAMIQTPFAWLVYIVVGFSISEYIYNYVGRKG
ncbi:hypothetical protein FKG94_11630 [Exilibacterium tricleocarpae]|uniref:Uncharacterized protein n=1 Tax=Exilibacterium tricleocarpae TaxID=2591008 RepID=A0A545TQL2_9GAMM|nr:hypothetical protein [Exilibacterium tricleocarpae]TQV79510.1 hypothetical protein FKG94_11630 [Exilibacterium tricleocarpae]